MRVKSLSGLSQTKLIGLLAALREGHSFKAACREVKLDYAVAYRWFYTGFSNRKSAHGHFRDLVLEAMGLGQGKVPPNKTLATWARGVSVKSRWKSPGKPFVPGIDTAANDDGKLTWIYAWCAILCRVGEAIASVQPQDGPAWDCTTYGVAYLPGDHRVDWQTHRLDGRRLSTIQYEGRRGWPIVAKRFHLYLDWYHGHAFEAEPLPTPWYDKSLDPPRPRPWEKDWRIT